MVRSLVALLCVVAVSGCGGSADSSDSSDSSGSTKPKPLTKVGYDLTVELADPGGTPSEAWLDGLRTWVQTGKSTGCPFGEAVTFVDALGPRRSDFRVATSDTDYSVVDVTDGMGAGDVPQGRCHLGHGGGGFDLEVSLLPQAKSGHHAIQLDQAHVDRVEGYARPVPLLGGEAWLRCYENAQSELRACETGWLYDDLYVKGRLFLKPSVEPQDAADWWVRGLSAAAGVQTEQEPTETGVSAVTWSYANESQYTFDATFELGELVPGSEAEGLAHPDGADAVLGQSCSIDPATDAVIPLSVTVEATTEGFPTPVSVAYTFAYRGSERPDSVSSSDGRIEVEQHFGDGVECESLSSVNPAQQASVKWNDPLDTGDVVRHKAFIVLHDFYSPAHPQGDLEWLRNEALVPSASDDYAPDTGETSGLELSQAANRTSSRT